MFDFLSLGKTIEGIRTKYQKISIEMSKIDAEIASTTNAPANRKDVIGSIENWVDKSAAEFTNSVASINKNKYSHGHVPPYTDGFFSLCVKNPGAFTNMPDGSYVEHMDVCMCALFGDQVKKSLTDALGKIPWLDEGLPKAERLKKLEKLNARKKEILSEKASLEKSAELANIDLAW